MLPLQTYQSVDSEMMLVIIRFRVRQFIQTTRNDEGFYLPIVAVVVIQITGGMVAGALVIGLVAFLAYQ